MASRCSARAFVRHSWSERRCRRPAGPRRPADGWPGLTSSRLSAMRAASADGRVLRLAAPPAPLPVRLGAPTGPSAKATRRAALALGRHGYCVCQCAFGTAAIAAAASEAIALYRKKRMAPGGFVVGGAPVQGRGQARGGNRDDHVLWLHEYLVAVGGPERGEARTLCDVDAIVSSFAQAVVEALSELPQADAPLGRAADGSPLYYTGRTDSMVACYPGGGAAYGPHIDNADGDGREAEDYGRCFTAVLYLNSRWDESQGGGALRIYLPPESAPAHDARHAVEVYPHGDTLVIFRADRIVHEVCPAFQARLALTVWMYAGNEEQGRKMRPSA
ncbi:hypothetical protein AB1Y20_001943 [Prymnesium parvum]|uniref:Fe2OG dioxygenase domain-containing protein n=1 Tax=Prymnesium parvum TaxID=97485 RepID=A0AB34J9R0_PRYPA